MLPLKQLSPPIFFLNLSCELKTHSNKGLLGLLCMLLVFIFGHQNVLAAEEVLVGNFPEKQLTQDINSIPSTHMGRIEEITVKPVPLEKIDFSKYVIDTKGYGQATINIFGFKENVDVESCRIGVIMLPNEKAIIDAYKNDNFTTLVEEINLGVSKDNKYFQGQLDLSIKFPSYLIGFYNLCSTNVSMSYYAYLKK